MRNAKLNAWPSLLPLLTVLQICRVTVAVVLNYRNYLPPDFEADFLYGRQSYFWKGYHWAFYTHLASGPTSLILGLILLSDQFRLRFKGWHRLLGRIQAMNVLLLLTPSGLWMSYYAATGPVGCFGFASLAVATATCMALGWRTAVQRRFAEHRRWMQRCFVLLCSAVVIRMIGGLATVLDYEPDWPYPVAAWASWLVPLIVYETFQHRKPTKMFSPRLRSGADADFENRETTQPLPALSYDEA